MLPPTPAELSLLALLANRPGLPTTLADSTGYSTAYSILRGLRIRGLVASHTTPGQGNVLHWHLTRKGEAVLGEWRARHEALETLEDAMPQMLPTGRAYAWAYARWLLGMRANRPRDRIKPAAAAWVRECVERHVDQLLTRATDGRYTGGATPNRP